MIYDFDSPPDRRDSNSFKWDGAKSEFGREEILPLWVADMDFPCAEPILHALRSRLEHPVLGYSIRDDAYYRAVLNWLATRHDWKIDKSWLMFCPPGAIVAINALVNLFSEKGDEVIVQTPGYQPLLDIVTNNHRQLVTNPLKNIDGRYEIDFQDLQAKITTKSRLLLLCSPHNPTGRVWSRDELQGLATLCAQHNIIVISDEVHCDFVFQPNRHIPFGSLAHAERSATVISPSKSFNTAAIPQSSIIMHDQDMRERFQGYLDTNQLNLDNLFSAIAMVASYQHSADWLDQVINYVADNLAFLKRFISEKLPAITVIDPEGTYLVWLDFTGFNMPHDVMTTKLIVIGGVGLSDGASYKMPGFYRINMACSRNTLETGLTKIQTALGRKPSKPLMDSI